jgi:hypothetical protein
MARAAAAVLELAATTQLRQAVRLLAMRRGEALP